MTRQYSYWTMPEAGLEKRATDHVPKIVRNV